MKDVKNKNYKLEFEGKAVQVLKGLSKHFSANNKLSNIVLKGIKILEIAKEANTSTLYYKSPAGLHTINIDKL